MCGAGGTWGAWGACARTTAQSQTQDCGACGDGSQTRACQADATWGGYGTCRFVDDVREVGDVAVQVVLVRFQERSPAHLPDAVFPVNHDFALLQFTEHHDFIDLEHSVFGRDGLWRDLDAPRIVEAAFRCPAGGFPPMFRVKHDGTVTSTTRGAGSGVEDRRDQAQLA